MPRALELISGRVTAPSTTFTAVTMASGNTATVRAAREGSDVKLLQAWADNQGAGSLRIRSPRLHDVAQGLRFRISASDASPLMPWGIPQKLFPQDALTIEMTGSATAGDLEQFGALVYYPELEGVAARLASVEDVMRRMVHIETVENSLTLGTGGGYTGEEAINAEFDNLKANTDYALLGYLVDTECAAVRWRGADTGNLGVGGPGHETLRHVTSNWFIRLSQAYGLALIPVFNSANKAAILLDGVQDENGTAVIVTSIFAELGGAAGPAPGR